MRCCRELLDAIGRRQPWDARSLQQTDFRRSLSFLNVVGLGLGSCAGVGVYVISSHVTKNEAGPSSVLSVILASVTSLLAGLCHAELAGRLPRAGTGYTYCYVTLGELCAFVVGWGMILEHVLTAAVAAKAWGHYLDYMINDTVTGEIENLGSWQLPDTFSSHPDVLGCVVMLIVSLCSFLSVKVFSVLTFTLAVLSGFILLAFVCVGYFHVQAHNWTQPPGFFAHGFSGTLSGAALLMSVFAGLDHAAAASQEMREPSRQLPSALPLTSTLLFVLLVLATSALTLSCPWQDLAEQAPMARAFESKGIYAANHVIGAGALLGLLATALGRTFHPPRILHCMARDGLLPGCLGKTSLASTPVVGGLLTGLLASAVALTFDFSCLIEMSAIATVVQFLTSAVIVLYVRYQPDPVGLCKEYSDLDLSMDDAVGSPTASLLHHHHHRAESPKLLLMANGDLHLHYQNHNNCELSPPPLSKSNFAAAASRTRTSSQTEFMETSALFSSSAAGGNVGGGGLSSASAGGGAGGIGGFSAEDACRRVVRSSASSLSSLVQLSSCTKLVPDLGSWQTTRYLLLVFLLADTCLAATSLAWPAEPQSAWWAVALACVSVALLVASGLGIARQPQSDVKLYFKAPYVPLLPLLALVMCTLLLAALPAVAWLRFALWTGLGLIIYFLYGIRHSVHRSQDDQEVVLFDISNRTY